MRGVTISDSRPDGNVLAFDLIDILRLLGPPATNSTWAISGVEAVGRTAADELQRLANARHRVPFPDLVALAGAVEQVVEGVFTGYQHDQETAWIVIRAVDSSAYDVETTDEDLLGRISHRFRDVTEFSVDDPPSEAHQELGRRQAVAPEAASR